MQKTVWMMCGLAGSGKSTFCNKNFPTEIVVAEDPIRYQVEDKYCYDNWPVITEMFHIKIQTVLEQYNTVAIDASFIDIAHRQPTVDFIRSIAPQATINFIVMTTTALDCVQNNNLRRGRAKIATDLIFTQNQHFIDPCQDSNNYNAIIYVDQNGTIEKIK